MVSEPTWRVFGQDTIACLLAPAEVPGWLHKNITVMPEEAAVVLRNGRVDDTVTYQRVGVPGLMDNIWNKVKSLAGRDEQVDVMMVDTSLKDITLPVTFVAQDKERIEGECRMRLRASAEQAHLLFGVLKRVSMDSKLKRSEVLGVMDIYEKLRIEWAARALEPVMTQHTSLEFRGSKKLQDEAEMASLSELRNLLARWGLLLEGHTINWALTEAEKQQLHLNQQRREEDLKDFENSVKIGELRRQNQIDGASIENLQRLKTLTTKGDEEERTLVLKYELGRVALQDDQRLGTAAIDDKIHALQMVMKKREVDLDIYADREEMNIAVEGFKVVQENKRLRDQQRIDTQEKVTLAALERGIKPSDLKDFYREQTLQRMAADGSDAQVQAMAQAEADGRNLDTYREAEDRERRFHGDSTRLSADLMQAAKPEMPQTLVQGGTPSTHMMIDGSATPKPAAAPKNALVCSCGEPLESGWKACPVCRAPVLQPQAAAGGTCPNCREPVKPTWKVCPSCEHRLERLCPECQQVMQPSWKACPDCGIRLP